MKYPYNKKIKHLSKFDKELSILYDSFDGLNQHDNKLVCLFKVDLTENEKLSLDNLVNNFVDTPDLQLQSENDIFERKRVGQRFDNRSIAVLTSDGFAPDINKAIAKYGAFQLVRDLIKDGLFHYALRVYVRDIIPSKKLSDHQSEFFRAELRGLVTKYFPDENLETVEAGE